MWLIIYFVLRVALSAFFIHFIFSAITYDKLDDGDKELLYLSALAPEILVALLVLVIFLTCMEKLSCKVRIHKYKHVYVTSISHVPNIMNACYTLDLMSDNEFSLMTIKGVVDKCERCGINRLNGNTIRC